MNDGPVSRALESDLSALGADAGLLVQLAREIAAGVDSGALRLIDGSRELRQLWKALAALSDVEGGPDALDAFLASIRADG